MHANRWGMARLALTSALTLFPAIALLGACDPEVADPEDMEEEAMWDEDDEEAVSDPDGTEDPGTEPSVPSQPVSKPDATYLCEDSPYDGYSCTTEGGAEGTQYCILVDGDEFYTPCSTEVLECEPGWNEDYGCLGDICYWDGESFRSYSWSEPDCNTPLVLNFEDTPVEFSPASAASFDLSPDGTCMSTDWPTAPWLALDRDGDGFISDGGELFGSATAMSSGGYAQHGFAALAELDTNRDGKITAKDERFEELVLWNDLDDDRIGAYGELRPLAQTTLVAIDLGFGRRASCDRQGNCGVERASFEYRDAKGDTAIGEVVDVHLACR